MSNNSHDQIVSFIWRIADDVLRDIFVRGKYRDIILPFTVLRRLDAMLVPTKKKVLETLEFLHQEKINDFSALKSVTGLPFWNTSQYTFDSLLNDAAHIDSNLETYLDGYSDNVQEIISKFKLRNQLETMKENEITYLLIEKFASKDINLSPIEVINGKGQKLPPLTNLGMGYVFEELIRQFNEENNEEAGEHFTPREIIRLMTHILFTPVKDNIQKGSFLIYDPACGSGGMLTEAEHFAEQITGRNGGFELYGQEVNPETYAICTSDMLIKGDKPENIAFGSTLSKDGFPNLKFDFMLSNPPYGKTWKLDEPAIVSNRGKKGNGERAENIKDHRFQVGLPSISDGQLLFLMNMVSKMKHNTELGSRIATVHNGSALFTGDAGGGESEIRRHIIENDWLECIIALPKNIFYNTGIPTYVWIVSNRKAPHRKGKIQLINAVDLYVKLRKNLGDKNCELKQKHIEEITKLYLNFKESDISKIYPNEFFGYNKITVERPLRLSVQFSAERIKEALFEEKIQIIVDKLAESIGREQFNDYNTFRKIFSKALKSSDIKLDAKTQKTILDALTWINEDAEPVIKSTDKGVVTYEPDSNLRDTENIPLSEDIQTYFQREVLAYIPDAWIDHSKTVKGYEISFTRYFYNYIPPRDINEIMEEIKLLTKDSDLVLNKIISEK